MKAIKRAKVIFERTNYLFMCLAAVIVVVDAIAVSVDTIMRYAFRKSAVGIFELTEYSMVWMTFLATTWLLQYNKHVRLDAVVNLLNQRHRLIVDMIVFCLVSLLLGITTWFSASGIVYYYQRSIFWPTVLQLPRWSTEIIVPIGCLLLFIQSLRKTYGIMVNLKALSRGTQIEPESMSGEPK